MEVSKADSLLEFLSAYEGVPVTWGVDDCSAVFAKWLAIRGVRVALPSYVSREGAHAIIAECGGLVETWEAILGGRLNERHDAPELGDIAVIDSRLHGPVGVICGAGGIAAWRKEDSGFFWLAPRRFIKVWAVP